MRANGEQVTVHRYSLGAGDDGFGNRVASWTDEVVRRCTVWTVESVVPETGVGAREVVAQRFGVHFRGALQVSFDDEVTIRGVRCRLYSKPRALRSSATGRVHGTRIEAEVITS